MKREGSPPYMASGRRAPKAKPATAAATACDEANWVVLGQEPDLEVGGPANAFDSAAESGSAAESAPACGATTSAPDSGHETAQSGDGASTDVVIEELK